jgi:hypothetical protein
MKACIYEVEDEDVLDTFFSEDAPPRPMAAVGVEHGKLIFKDKLSSSVQENDIIIVNDVEYFVLLRIIHADVNEMELLVHRRHFEGSAKS